MPDFGFARWHRLVLIGHLSQLPDSGLFHPQLLLLEPGGFVGVHSATEYDQSAGFGDTRKFVEGIRWRVSLREYPNADYRIEFIRCICLLYTSDAADE